jgi:CheY-like chemotaxis protein
MIVVADDEQSLCDLMEAVLEQDYEVIKASNGKEALELIQQHHPQLVISDIMMPISSGLDLLRLVRNNPETSQLPVILMSAALKPPPEVAPLVTFFVRKPFEIEVLEQLVAKALKRPVPAAEAEIATGYAPEQTSSLTAISYLTNETEPEKLSSEQD